jgi:pyruvate dehydrogenase E2 component (dihydrolipoamide acetyltransferase)
MATDVKLNDWADKSEASEAAVSVWFKKPGAPVKQGELLAELIVEKVNLEIESPTEGILLEICAPVGEAVHAGATLARLGSQEEWAKLANVATIPPIAPAPSVATTTSEAVASPIAKRLMREHNLSLDEIAAFAGSGVRRIGEEEVRKYLESRTALASSKLVPYAGLRRIIGERMSRSMREMAQLTISNETDVTDLVAERERLGKTAGFTALIARAVALSMPKHPYINAALEGDNIRLHSQLHLGIAVEVPDGLVVPVIKEAEKRSVLELTGEITRLSELARQNKLKVENNSGATFTITTLGSYDIDMFTPIVNPPQVAILGVGRIADRAGVVKGQLAARKLLWLSLSFDHRIIDGAPAAAFLKEVKQLLENPERLFS